MTKDVKGNASVKRSTVDSILDVLYTECDSRQEENNVIKEVLFVIKDKRDTALRELYERRVEHEKQYDQLVYFLREELSFNQDNETEKDEIKLHKGYNR